MEYNSRQIKMKKRVVLCLMFLGVSFSPYLSINSSAVESVDYTEITLAYDDGWQQDFVNGYDKYGQYIHQLQVLKKYKDGRLYVKARLAGTSQDYRYAVYGPFNCDGDKFSYKVDLGVVLYFNL